MAFKVGGGLLQGLLGNMSEVSVESLTQEYKGYLMDGESIQTGFKLIRDALVITDRRILSFDKQGTTGQKMRVDSIYLSSIYHVTAETAGFGLDDSELTISYITTPYMKSHSVGYASKKFEFPKKYNIQGLYKMLQELAYDNYTRLNG
ncbi:MAG: PH domain-containing protein [Oscillospiraceae bacterium]|nr:PH domain-containing protein [Oscillospiraceae bacterium]